MTPRSRWHVKSKSRAAGVATGYTSVLHVIVVYQHRETILVACHEIYDLRVSLSSWRSSPKLACGHSQARRRSLSTKVAYCGLERSSFLSQQVGGRTCICENESIMNCRIPCVFDSVRTVTTVGAPLLDGITGTRGRFLKTRFFQIVLL